MHVECVTITWSTKHLSWLHSTSACLSIHLSVYTSFCLCIFVQCIYVFFDWMAVTVQQLFVHPTVQQQYCSTLPQACLHDDYVQQILVARCMTWQSSKQSSHMWACQLGCLQACAHNVCISELLHYILSSLLIKPDFSPCWCQMGELTNLPDGRVFLCNGASTGEHSWPALHLLCSSGIPAVHIITALGLHLSHSWSLRLGYPCSALGADIVAHWITRKCSVRHSHSAQPACFLVALLATCVCTDRSHIPYL